MRPKYKFHQNINEKCHACESYGWYGGELGYQCERHWCVDNSLFKEYELKIIKKEDKSKP